MKNKNYFFVMLLVTAFLVLSCQNENPISTSENESLLKSKPTTVTCVFDLSPEEEAGLIYMRLEEKLARDVYIFLYGEHNRQLFNNISVSEQIHMDKMLVLLDNYGITDPALSGEGLFNEPEFQHLYDSLTAQGQVSFQEALLVGEGIENLDIEDLEYQLNNVVSGNPDIENVYTNLLTGSQNHLATFLKHIALISTLPSTK